MLVHEIQYLPDARSLSPLYLPGAKARIGCPEQVRHSEHHLGSGVRFPERSKHDVLADHFPLQGTGHPRGELEAFPGVLQPGQVLVRPTVGLDRPPGIGPRHSHNSVSHEFANEDAVLREQARGIHLGGQSLNRLVRVAFMKRKPALSAKPLRQHFGP